MDENPFTLKNSTSVERVFQLISEKNLTHILITDDEEKIIGIVSRKGPLDVGIAAGISCHGICRTVFAMESFGNGSSVDFRDWVCRLSWNAQYCHASQSEFDDQ